MKKINGTLIDGEIVVTQGDMRAEYTDPEVKQSLLGLGAVIRNNMFYVPATLAVMQGLAMTFKSDFTADASLMDYAKQLLSIK